MYSSLLHIIWVYITVFTSSSPSTSDSIIPASVSFSSFCSALNRLKQVSLQAQLQYTVHEILLWWQLQRYVLHVFTAALQPHRTTSMRSLGPGGWSEIDGTGMSSLISHPYFVMSNSGGATWSAASARMISDGHVSAGGNFVQCVTVILLWAAAMLPCVHVIFCLAHWGVLFLIIYSSAQNNAFTNPLWSLNAS